jgi:GNAT superfamily N-acetyltransferase
MTIKELSLNDYFKCNNIWDMNKDPDRTKCWYDEIAAGNRTTFVYIEDVLYLGEVSLVKENGDDDYTVPGQRIYLSRMIVKKENRNQGIGGLLLNHTICYAKRLGYSEISLGVDISNVGARWLYEKNGFTNIIFVGEDKDGKFVKLIKTI